jgi:F0F1-type ATP synthase delta subunit
MIVLSIFLNLFFAQVVVGAIVVVCLKKVLDGQLLEFAYRQIDYWKPQDQRSPISEITLVTHKRLNVTQQERFRRITLKRLGAAVTVQFLVDRKIMGGAILRIGEKLFDYSLKDRLRQAFSYR